jgi:hypothetical protein
VTIDRGAVSGLDLELELLGLGHVPEQAST